MTESVDQNDPAPGSDVTRGDRPRLKPAEAWSVVMITLALNAVGLGATYYASTNASDKTIAVQQEQLKNSINDSRRQQKDQTYRDFYTETTKYELPENVPGGITPGCTTEGIDMTMIYLDRVAVDIYGSPIARDLANKIYDGISHHYEAAAAGRQCIDYGVSLARLRNNQKAFLKQMCIELATRPQGASTSDCN